MPELTVGITGATGFVGGRLAERLVLAGPDAFSVVAAVRRYSGAGLARLARLPVRLELAGLLDGDALARAFDGCDVIVHCAYGTGGPMEERRRVTVEGTRNVLRAAEAAGGSRVIHLSTAAVHRTDGDGAVDEESSFVSGGSFYEQMKIEAEEAVWEAHRERGLPAVVLRPTLVHGPRGRRWTVRIAEEVREGAVLPDGARAPANLVYVDNVVDAVLRSAREDDAVGEAFLLVDDEPPAWGDVYRAYARLFPDAPPPREASAAEIRAERRRREPGLLRGSLVEPFRVLPEVVRAAVGPQEIRDRLWNIPWLAGPARLLPDGLKARIKGEASGGDGGGGAKGAGPGGGDVPPLSACVLPDPDMVELYTSPVAYSARKAARLLGDWQGVGFREGMERIGAWLRWQRIAPPAAAADR